MMCCWTFAMYSYMHELFIYLFIFYSYNFLKLNIYYQDLNFENITEEPEIAVREFYTYI